MRSRRSNLNADSNCDGHRYANFLRYSHKNTDSHRHLYQDPHSHGNGYINLYQNCNSYSQRDCNDNGNGYSQHHSNGNSNGLRNHDPGQHIHTNCHLYFNRTAHSDL